MDKGLVTRLMLANKLERALRRARDRAQQAEAKATQAELLQQATERQKGLQTGKPKRLPTRKSLAFPEGNFTACRPVDALLVQTLGEGTPAFTDSRAVRSYLRRLDGCGERLHPVKVVQRAILHLEGPSGGKIRAKLERLPRWKPDGQGGLQPELPGKLRPVMRPGRTIGEALKNLTGALMEARNQEIVERNLEKAKAALPAFLRFHLGLDGEEVAVSELLKRLQLPVPPGPDGDVWIRWVFRGRMHEIEIPDPDRFIRRLGRKREVWLVNDFPGDPLQIVVPVRPLDVAMEAA